jgi:Family of unknown function (DUF6262)
LAVALAARRTSTQAALKRVRNAISRLRKEKTPISVAVVSRRAGVSRTFLYSNPEARSAVAAAIAEADERRGHALVDLDDHHEARWRERALNAEHALKTANAEILNQRTRIGELLGQIRDLEANGPRRPSNGSPPRTPPSSSAFAKTATDAQSKTVPSHAASTFAAGQDRVGNAAIAGAAMRMIPMAVPKKECCPGW